MMRNSNIEFFRFILMIAICFWHIIVHGYGLINLRDGVFSGTMFDIISTAFLVPAVNCFMLISGFYGIKFSIKKILRFSFLGFSILWVALLVSQLLEYDGSISIKYNLMHLLPISTKAWWFLTEYVCIMVLSPFIDAGLSKITRRKFICILVIFLFMNSFGLYINHGSTGNNLFSLLIVYLIGRWLNRYPKKIQNKSLFLGWACSTMAIAFLLAFFVTKNQPKVAWLVLYYNNPLVVFQSICLFLMVLNLKERHSKVGLFLGANCFSIYLLTEKLGKPLYLSWASQLENSCISFIWSFTTIVSVSVLLNYVLSRLFDCCSKMTSFMDKLDDFVERK